MPVYRITYWFNGYATYEVEANSEEEAMDLYYEGDMDLIEEEHTDGGFDRIVCLTDENDIEHHRRRRRGNV